MIQPQVILGPLEILLHIPARAAQAQTAGRRGRAVHMGQVKMIRLAFSRRPVGHQPELFQGVGSALHEAHAEPGAGLAERDGGLEIEALAFIRGRSIARRFFILDEAQQLTPHEVKTVITRISEGSKIVLIGDPAQIDNPYVDSRSNGLAYAHNRMKGQILAAHVKLMKGERSKLAELAADLL